MHAGTRAREHTRVRPRASLRVCLQRQHACAGACARTRGEKVAHIVMETLTNTNTPVHTARTEILSRSSSSEAKSVKTHRGAAGSPCDGDSPRSPAWPGCPHGFLAPLARCWAELGWKVPEDHNPGGGSGTRVRQLPHCRRGTPTRQRCTSPPLPGHHFCSSLLLIPSHFCGVSLLCV